MAQGVVGRPLDRPEGPLKVSGLATYAHEYNLPGSAYGVLVRATKTKGRVRSIASDAVKAMPGILAVITDERLLRNPAQGTADEAPVQDPSKVAYLGQPIALVVAETFEEARHGALSLEIEIEAESAPVGPDDVAPEKMKGKTIGDLDRAMAEATFTIDATYTTPAHNSAAMEPHASIASWGG